MTDKRGTTIIEVIVYIGLLGLIMTSSVLILVQILQGSEQLETMVRHQDEALFILEKIGNEIALGATVASPAPGSSSHSLTLASPAGIEIHFALTGSTLTIARNGDDAKKLHAPDLPVSSFTVNNHGATSTVRMILGEVEYAKIF